MCLRAASYIFFEYFHGPWPEIKQHANPKPSREKQRADDGEYCNCTSELGSELHGTQQGQRST